MVNSNGKVALVTGANSGIGAITARELALQGYHVFLACRSESKTRPVLDEINRLSQGAAKAEFLRLDLGDLESVRQCAQTFLAKDLPLHVLICNAGIAGQKGMTASGFELIFGVCHVGHFLLTQLLTERLKASAPSRVVVVSSKAHRHVRSIDFDKLHQPTQSPGAIKEYAVAKLANLLFVQELARKFEGTGVTTYAVHPGIVASNIWRALPVPLENLLKKFMVTPEEGAKTSLYCAIAPQVADQSGLYYENCQVRESSRLASNPYVAATLWQLSEQWTH